MINDSASSAFLFHLKVRQTPLNLYFNNVQTNLSLCFENPLLCHLTSEFCVNQQYISDNVYFNVIFSKSIHCMEKTCLIQDGYLELKTNEKAELSPLLKQRDNRAFAQN